MPRRHGVSVSTEFGVHLRLGIWQVFDPWIKPALLVAQGFNIRHQQIRPQRIEFHFRRTAMRLVRSLARFHDCVRDYDQFLSEGALSGPHALRAFDTPEEAGIAADSIFFYLNSLIDDLARIIPFVFAGKGVEPRDADDVSFSALKRQGALEAVNASEKVRELFASLERDESWWSRGFRRGTGIRQRLTHYTDLIYFSANTKNGDDWMTRNISLTAIGGPVQFSNFENVLSEMLSDLCEWLDQLEHELVTHLSNGLASGGVNWDPFAEKICKIRLPNGDFQPIKSSHHLYLPVCLDPE